MINTEDIQNMINDATNSGILNREEAESINSNLEPTVNNSESSKVQNNIIPQNSPSILIGENTARFSDAVWYQKMKESSVILAGIGGIGSYVAYMLSRIQPYSLTIYDPDKVETVNLAGQLYSIHDVDKYKVSAISEFIESYSDYYNTSTVRRKFESSDTCGPIMICGFDNMKARKTFFYSWLEYVSSRDEEDRKNCLFIDGRLAAEEFQIFAITGNDRYNIIRYKDNYLFSDEDADETICSYKQTTFCSEMIASMMVNIYVNFIANTCDIPIPRDVPFFTSYNAERMFFKTEY